ncbi:MAG: hypothetical protein LBG82_01295, partial [Clostridiales Family XIII bacterium]|nr:hypothetical protein [Clostridiales Family XIII bacterium]
MPKTAKHAFKIIESDLSGGALREARAVLLFGDESYLVDHYERMLRVMFIARGMESRGFSRVVWGARNVVGAAPDGIAAGDTLPLRSERRVV